MMDVALIQFDLTVVIRVLDDGVVVVTGLTPSAASTLVFAVVADFREYQVTSSSPALLAVRIARNMCRPPVATRLSTTGSGWTGWSEPVLKLSSRMSPSGWNRVSFQKIGR